MAKIPYQPFASEDPSTQGTPGVHLDTPISAFGGAVAQSTSRFGHTLDQAGNELFQTALELKRYESESNVNEATTRNLLQTGEQVNNFRQLQGKDAQNRLQDHVAQLEKIREENRKGLKSPYEQKLFDRETMHRFGYDVINSSNYAATQLKQYNTQTRAALTATLQDGAARDPNNEQFLLDTEKRIRGLQRRESFEGGELVGATLQDGEVVGGKESPLSKFKADVEVGKMVKSAALAIEDPIAARKMLEGWKSKILETDYKAIDQSITKMAQSRIIDQNRLDAAHEKQVGDAQDALIDRIVRNSTKPPGEQDPSLTRAAIRTSELFKDRPKDTLDAENLVDKLLDNSVDQKVSQENADKIRSNIAAGKVTNQRQLNAIVRELPVNGDDIKDLKTELKEQNPVVKQFQGAMNTWIKDNASRIDLKMITPSTGVIDPSLRTSLGQKKIEEWQSEVMRRAKVEVAAGNDPYALLDPNSKNSMTSPEALLPYRVTAAAAASDAAAQLKGPAGPGMLERLKGLLPSTPPPPMIAPKSLEGVQGLQINRKMRQFFDPAQNKYYNEKGIEEPRKMSFQQEDQGPVGAQGVIDAALQNGIDAHLDKNLFSSGRAERMGIAGGIGKNLTTVTSQGQSVQVNAEAAPHFRGFLNELKDRGYEITSLGGYNPRMKRGSFSSYSEHAFGNAIDINPDENPFRSRKTTLPRDIAQIAARYGLIWGGNWSGNSVDPMHFEWSGKGIVRPTRV